MEHYPYPVQIQALIDPPKYPMLCKTQSCTGMKPALELAANLIIFKSTRLLDYPSKRTIAQAVKSCSVIIAVSRQFILPGAPETFGIPSDFISAGILLYLCLAPRYGT